LTSCSKKAPLVSRVRFLSDSGANATEPWL
jgi:hypothetical protein